MRMCVADSRVRRTGEAAFIIEVKIEKDTTACRRYHAAI